MDNNIFISRNLAKDSVFRTLLAPTKFSIIDKSLIEFSPTPFSQIPNGDWLFFYSKNGVNFFFEGLHQLGLKSAYLLTKKWAAIGQGTADSLRQYIHSIDFIGTGEAESTSAAFLKVATGQQVVFIRAKTSNLSIHKALKNRIIIKDLIAYENTIRQDFNIPYCKYLVFTSSLNVQAYFQKYAPQKEQIAIAIGEPTAVALQNLGMPNIIVAKQPNEEAMARAVIDSL